MTLLSFCLLSLLQLLPPVEFFVIITMLCSYSLQNLVNLHLCATLLHSLVKALSNAVYGAGLSKNPKLTSP